MNAFSVSCVPIKYRPVLNVVPVTLNGCPSAMAYLFALSAQESTEDWECILGELDILSPLSQTGYVIVNHSFVRSVTMDKWKDSELEKMKVATV